ncbi:MAG TPA: hypothetical protein VJ385_15370 [Fibrobacteria bacterium]|nr:hypothetical protein [Fibrobacteria bacterium]
MSFRRGRAGSARVELGEAISFEDVLTVMTVLLLLRLVFMVPLVNLDKARTIAARSDKYWSLQALYVLAHPGDPARVRPYRNAFGLEGEAAMVTEGDADRSVFLEAATPDSNLTVLRHNLKDGSFIAMNVQGRGHSVTFRRGKLIWSRDESEWFPASDSVDYGTRPESKAMEREFREWTKGRRGY